MARWLGIAIALSLGCTQTASPPDLDLADPAIPDLAILDLTIQGFDFAGVEAATSCPAGVPIARSPCALGLQCTYSGACATQCFCDDSNPGTARSGQWVCAVDVGPGCSSSLCPVTAPVSDGGVEPCSQTLSETRCTYTDQPPGCSTACTCSAQPGLAGVYWGCGITCDCPAAAPSEGDPCDSLMEHSTCRYPASQCTCNTDANHATPYWDCSASGCPGTPPTDGAPCNQVSDANNCYYPASVPYCGACQCQGGGSWACTASTCDQCPASPPDDMSRCDGLVGQSCSWLVPPKGGIGIGHTTFCDCMNVSFTPEWICHSV